MSYLLQTLKISLSSKLFSFGSLSFLLKNQWLPYLPSTKKRPLLKPSPLQEKEPTVPLGRLPPKSSETTTISDSKVKMSINSINLIYKYESLEDLGLPNLPIELFTDLGSRDTIM